MNFILEFMRSEVNSKAISDAFGISPKNNIQSDFGSSILDKIPEKFLGVIISHHVMLVLRKENRKMIIYTENRIG